MEQYSSLRCCNSTDFLEQMGKAAAKQEQKKQDKHAFGALSLEEQQRVTVEASRLALHKKLVTLHKKANAYTTLGQEVPGDLVQYIGLPPALEDVIVPVKPSSVGKKRKASSSAAGSEEKDEEPQVSGSAGKGSSSSSSSLTASTTGTTSSTATSSSSSSLGVEGQVKKKKKRN